ncbi:MAG: hypothetical protein WCK96_04415 [Methylococcales bacterium]
MIENDFIHAPTPVENGILDCNRLFHWLVIDKTYFNSNLLGSNLYTNQGEYDDSIIFSKVNTDDRLDELIYSDCNGNLFISKTNGEITELLSIYLVFLKYSSLVRYNPKIWNDKIRSKEIIIIEKFLHDLFIKYWAMCVKDLLQRDFIIV